MCIFFIIINYLILIHRADGEVGDYCISRVKRSRGLCLLVEDCEVALRSIKQKGNHPYERCGFDGTKEIVCCPKNEDPEKKYGENNWIRVSERECQKMLKSRVEALSLYIIGGDDASPGEFPHMAALGYNNTDSYTFDCGGSLISDTYILTAAHCADGRLENPPSIVRMGVLEICDKKFNELSDTRIAEIILHPKRTRRTKYHDIALIRLENPVQFNEFVNPICLYTSQDDPDVPFTVTGWGQTSVSRRVENITLQKAQLSFVDREVCGESYKISGVYWLKLPDGILKEQICANNPQGLTDTCQGDSGGPLQLFDLSNNSYRLVGVTSFGIGCGTSKPGVYTKISLYLDWIESVVWEL